MRYPTVARFNREQSLHAMWHAFRARSFADQQLVEKNAGVVCDLLNARCYSSDRGQFISEDPSFLSVGDPFRVKVVTGRDQPAFLADPQLANSYSYGRDNPITQKDPNGNAVTFDPVTTFLSTLFIPTAVGDPVFNADGSVSATRQQAGIDAVGFIGGFVTGGSEVKAVSSPSYSAGLEFELTGVAQSVELA